MFASMCLNENVFLFVRALLCSCVCVIVHALREKQLIIEFNRRNTVYPERYKASARDIERGREESLGEVGGDDLGRGR